MTEPYIDDEINLRDSWRVLVRRRLLILCGGGWAGCGEALTLYTDLLDG